LHYPPGTLAQTSVPGDFRLSQLQRTGLSFVKGSVVLGLETSAEMGNKVCNQMSVARAITIQSLLAVYALTFLGLLCPQIKAAEREISIHRFSSFPSALETRQVALSCPTRDLKGLGHLSLVADPKRTVVLFGAPCSVCTALLGNWVTEIMNKTETWLSNRTHMIQFCAIGMVLALIIIWWRKT
jgi:hypothetical protein